ncbi:MAG: N-formylglutamate amidohydrolase [Flavobacteriales bacterium]
MITILSCEHYSNHVPPEFDYLFEKGQEVLESHRGYDVRVEHLFHALSPFFDYCFHFPISRLLIEPNRSLHNRHLFSPFSLHLPKSERTRLIAQFYHPYRKSIEQCIGNHDGEPIVHISAHSFTPVLGNQNRESEIGLLFDPGNTPEKELAKLWKRELNKLSSARVRFNYPYRGKADGLTTYLRKCFPTNYSGIELEVRNDKIFELSNSIVDSLQNLFET